MIHSNCGQFRALALIATALIAGAVSGCARKSEPGGPGSVRFAGERPGGAEAEDIFRLLMPTKPVTIRRGSSTDVNFRIERGRTFDQEVLLKFVDLPGGVSAAPAEPVIRRGNSVVNVRFSASNEAKPGVAAVKVFANPYKGPQAHNEFNLAVEK